MRNLGESVFWEIFHRRETVRAELAQHFQVSAATVSRAVGVLISKQLVVETGAPAGSLGRRPTLLRMNPSLAYVGGIELDRNMITAVVTDLGGNLLGRGATAASSANSVEATLRDCVRTLRIALRDAGLPQTRLARIGVGHTAALDVENGLCVDWEGSPHWRRVPLADALRATFKTEITLDDRARAVALPLHLTWPEGRRHRIAIYVQIGTGIGSGIFIDGRLLRGATQSAGEIGHIAIDCNGPLCACGRQGCVEAYASLGATMARVRDAIEQGDQTALSGWHGRPSPLTAEDVVLAARQGDAVARSVLNQTGEALGLGIANAVQLLNPSLVALTGKFCNTAGDFLLEAVKRAISSRCFETLSRELEIRVAPLRKDVGPVGCALMATLDVAADLLQRALFGPAA
jgi:N-acetylglucosamine repressor